MPELRRFAQAELPAVVKWQALAFMKCEWPGVFSGERLFMSDPYPVGHAPVHFAVVEGDALIAFASVMELPLVHAGETYRTHALGNVFTFAPYRHHGFARQVVDAATAHIVASAADVAILFCAPERIPFYAIAGWQTIDGARTLVGAEQREYDSPVMMLFVSDKGMAARKTFADEPLRVAYTW